MKKIVISLIFLLFVPSVTQANIPPVSDDDYIISDETGYEGGIFILDGFDTLLVTGAGASNIYANDDSYVEVRGTAPLQQDFGGIYALDLDDSSILNYEGGETNDFTITENAIATFSGGRIDYIWSFQDSDILKHITFICDVDSVDLTGDLLTGDWLGNKGSFSITLLDQLDDLDHPEYDSVYSNINFVPEPATMLMLGLGGLLIRKKKK